MIGQKFLGEIIAVTGDEPHYSESVERIVRLEGGTVAGTVGDDGSWQVNQTVVVGRVAFAEDYLVESIKVGLRHGFTCCYMSQEAFWGLWLWDECEPYYKGDPRIDEHPGLSFLTSLGFKWPTFQDVQGAGKPGNEKNLIPNPSSDLSSATT